MIDGFASQPSIIALGAGIPIDAAIIRLLLLAAGPPPVRRRAEGRPRRLRSCTQDAVALDASPPARRARAAPADRRLERGRR